MGNGSQKKLFAQVTEALQRKGLLLKKGTIVDSTLIAAPSSTKNQKKQRDPEAHQVKKGTSGISGTKPISAQIKTAGLVHDLEVTSANVHDATVMQQLLPGNEKIVCGGSGYLGAEKRENAVVRNRQEKRGKYKINRRPPQSRELSSSGQWYAKKVEHGKSSVRAKIGHVFGVVKE